MFESEDRTGNRNRAIGYLLREYGILEEDPQTTLGSVLPAVLDGGRLPGPEPDGGNAGRRGVHPVSGDRVLDAGLNERVLSVMTTCGMYNAAGDWVTEVGLPAKSGVGGGILAVLPGQLGLAVFSPRLDKHGNSVRGIVVPADVPGAGAALHVPGRARSAVESVRDLSDNPSLLQRPVSAQEVLHRHGGRVQDLWAPWRPAVRRG